MSEGGHTAPRLSRAATDIRQSVFAALQGRVDAHRARGGDLIPLHIGDTHLSPPGVAAAIDPGDLSLYGKVAGLEELRVALADFRRERGLGALTGPEQIHVGCGCTHALFCAARAVLDPGDEVLVVAPYWPLVIGVLRTAGAVPVEVVGLEGLAAARTDRTRAIYYVSPNNPDGRVFDEAALDVVADLARAHDLWVFADEVYADFVYDGEHQHLAARPEMAGRTISCFSLSKSHGLAGARIGYVVAPPEVVVATRRMSNHTVYNVPVSMQRVALAAVRDGAPWLASARAEYHATRDAAARALEDIGLSPDVPRGGSFFFLDLGPVVGEGTIQPLLERAIDEGVLLAPGEAFGAGFERHLRLCFTGAPRAEVLAGIRRLGRAMEALS